MPVRPQGCSRDKRQPPVRFRAFPLRKLKRKRRIDMQRTGVCRIGALCLYTNPLPGRAPIPIVVPNSISTTSRRAAASSARRRPKRRIGSRVYKTCSRCWRKRSAWEALKAAREAHEALALEAELRAADRRVDALRQAALRRKAAELLAQLEANRLRKDDRPLELAPPLEA